MKRKAVELVFLGLAVGAVFFTAGYFTGRRGGGDIAVTVENRVVEPVGEAAAEPGVIDLNTAGRWQLMSLPGVGETLSGRILDYREEHGAFTYKEELLAVPGIGETLYEAIADLVTV